MRYDFMILDVFTDKAFGGNQLAVLTDARGISAQAMQMIAREFDYPETTFVLPPSDPSYARRVRIFTPGGELPFAGHPTVGTACALAMAGHTEVGEVILEEGVGPVAVVTTNVSGAYSARLRLSRGPDVSDAVPPVEELAAALSLRPGEIAEPSARAWAPGSPSFRWDRARSSTARSSISSNGGEPLPRRGALSCSCSPASSATSPSSMAGCMHRASASPRIRRPERQRPPLSAQERRRAGSGMASSS